MSKRLARICSARLIFSIWFARNESGAETENFQKVEKGF
jgi:hypothetical protein